MINDFVTVLSMLTSADIPHQIKEVEGEHPCIVVPSRSPYYDEAVGYSFNDDGSLYSVHSCKPDPDEDCGCGGCEFTIAECVAEIEPNDELVELEEFIGAVYRFIEEQRRADDEV